MNYSKHSRHDFPAFGRSDVLKVRGAAPWQGEGSHAAWSVAAAVPASHPVRPVHSSPSRGVSLGSRSLSVPYQSTQMGRIDLS